MTQLAYPDGRVVGNTYDTSQHLTQVQYASWNSQSVGYNYLSSATYAPDGTVQTMTYGNGAIEANTENIRLQPQESALQTDAGGVLENVWNKWYCYGPSDTYCPALGKNRGNIQRVLDLHTNNHSQGGWPIQAELEWGDLEDIASASGRHDDDHLQPCAEREQPLRNLLDKVLVELSGIEPLTSSLRTRRSPS